MHKLNKEGPDVDALVLFRTLTDQSNDAIEIINPVTGGFIDANMKAWQELGYNRDEFLKLTLFDIDPAINVSVFQNWISESREKEYMIIESVHKRKDGSEFPVEISLKYIKLERDYIVTVVRNITSRKKLADELSRNTDIKNVINTLLKLALEEIPVKELFRKALELIVSLPWLAVEKKGAIFLTNENRILEMQASYGLNDAVINICKYVPPGKCICGLTLSAKKPVYTSEIDHRHDVNYPGMDDHGHYCVPVMFSGECLGVINTYIAKGHLYSALEMDFLNAVANTLASIIVRKKAEYKLQMLNETLENRVVKRTNELAEVNKQIINELSRRKTIETSLSKSVKFLSLLIETIPNPIFYKDTAGVFIDCNNAFADHIGKTKNGIKGKTVSDLFPKEIADIYSEKDDELLNNPGVQVYESRTNTENGRYKYVTNYKATFTDPDGKVAGIVGIIIDITKTRQAEEEIKENLEKEKELNMLKSRFIAVVSHEFRTPLTGIRSSIQLLERFGHKWDDSKKKEVFSDIYKSIQYTNMLLEDVSLIGKDDSGRITFNASLNRIEDVCRKSINDVKAMFNDSVPVNFNIVPETITAFVDESLLRHILNNLLSNSVKYSGTGSKVDLIVTVSSGNIVFKVIDNGIGIPENEIRYVFDAFHRASNAETIKGTGLGLSIVRRCVELHGGSIKIDSKVNDGTTATLLIPYLSSKPDAE